MEAIRYTDPATDKNPKSDIPGNVSLYEPLSSASMDKLDRVYTTCKQNSLGRAKPIVKSSPSKLRDSPKVKLIAWAISLSLLTVILLITFALAVAAISRNRPMCIEESESRFWNLSTPQDDGYFNETGYLPLMKKV